MNLEKPELTTLEWQFQLYLMNLPIQDRAIFKSRSTLSQFSVPELSEAFLDARRLLNTAWADGAHRIIAPEGPVVIHLDYIESPIINAITFGSDGSYFVGITEPFLALFCESSGALWRANFLADLLEIEMSTEVRDFLFQVLLLFQLQFISSHELGHLFHGHQRGLFRKEFTGLDADRSTSRMRGQARELDADGYAVHLLLNGILRTTNGAQIHRRLRSRLPMEDCILNLFLLSAGAAFYFLDPGVFTSSDVRKPDHPFALARMNFVMKEITSWCEQHLPTYAGWGTIEQFQWVMACVASVANSPERLKMWTDQGTFLLTGNGSEYLDDLYTEKLSLRQSMDGSQWKLG